MGSLIPAARICRYGARSARLIRAKHQGIDLLVADRICQARNLRRNGGVPVLERVACNDPAILLRERPIEAGANRFVVLNRVVQQHVCVAPAMLLDCPLRQGSALNLGGAGRCEGEIADAEYPGFRILRAKEHGQHPRPLRLQGSRRTVVVIAGREDQDCPLAHDFEPGFRAFGTVGLRVRLHHPQLAAEQPTLRVGLFDEQLRHARAVAIIGFDEARQGDREAKHDVVRSSGWCDSPGSPRYTASQNGCPDAPNGSPHFHPLGLVKARGTRCPGGEC